MGKRTVPVCFTEEQHRAIEGYARRRGMTDAGQALEAILAGA